MRLVIFKLPEKDIRKEFELEVYVEVGFEDSSLSSLRDISSGASQIIGIQAVTALKDPSLQYKNYFI